MNHSENRKDEVESFVSGRLTRAADIDAGLKRLMIHLACESRGLPLDFVISLTLLQLYEEIGHDGAEKKFGADEEFFTAFVEAGLAYRRFSPEVAAQFHTQIVEAKASHGAFKQD